MIRIREPDKISSEYIKKIGVLHKKAFPAFFLTQLGLPFLCTLYAGYIEDSNSGIIVAEDEGELIGFLAYSNDYPRFYKELIKNHLIKFAFCSFRVAIYHPSFIKRLFGAFKKASQLRRAKNMWNLPQFVSIRR